MSDGDEQRKRIDSVATTLFQSSLQVGGLAAVAAIGLDASGAVLRLSLLVVAFLAAMSAWNAFWAIHVNVRRAPAEVVENLVLVSGWWLIALIVGATSIALVDVIRDVVPWDRVRRELGPL